MAALVTTVHHSQRAYPDYKGCIQHWPTSYKSCCTRKFPLGSVGYPRSKEMEPRPHAEDVKPDEHLHLVHDHEAHETGKEEAWACILSQKPPELLES